MENEITDVDIVSESSTSIALKDGAIDSDLVIANIDAQEKILKRLIKYVQDNLVAGVDYYHVKKGQKDSLGQPGAQKINDFYKYYPKYHILSSTRNGREVSYEMECVLHDKRNNMEVGSGVGFCSSLEDKYRYKSVWENNVKKQVEIENHINLANTILKMAKKRCYVDATLSSTMASFIFTQDLEDGYVGSDYNQSDNDNTHKNTAKSELDYNPDTYMITGGKYKDKLMKDTSSSYIQWNIDQINQGKNDPSKYGLDKNKYLVMLNNCLLIATERETGKNPMSNEKMDDEDYKHLQEAFPGATEV